MEDVNFLCDTIKEKAFDYRIQYPEVPNYITANLRYDLFYWQKEAIEYFLTYQAIKNIEAPDEKTHLMFNMATGTGKTLLMAAMLLYYYKLGYRHFIFFVNQNNIVDKTENNFINSTHIKYLFKDKIIINDKTVNIKQVTTFSDNPENIEIKFTTIQKLYNEIHIVKENQTTKEDLWKRDIVMLADEAHHLNTDTTRKKEQEELAPTEITNKTGYKEIERKGWEHTVIEILLNKNNQESVNKNVLLEFTATIPTNKKIAEKYQDKMIYRFGLKDFLAAGYTKEINLLSSTLAKKERVLQALLFSWYRHKIALKNDIPNFKPVVLFRSKTIEESKADFEEFKQWVDTISAGDFKFIDNIMTRIERPDSNTVHEMGKSRTEQVINYIRTEDVSYSEIADFIKNNYHEKNVIITNSETNKKKTEDTTEEQERLLNSLEDPDNHIRAIFTVKRLTEGWDVLNLYDIVRLYQGQNAGGSTKKVPEATIQEKQLIGRGVRYYPFTYKDKIKNKRKFDNDLNNELRVLEELYYYTYDEDSRYISHLKKELKRDGYIRDDKVVKKFALKDEFKDSDFYTNTAVWYNNKIKNPERRKNTLEDLKNQFSMKYKIQDLELIEQEVEFDEDNGDTERLSVSDVEKKTFTIYFKDIEKHIFRKAMNIKAKSENSFFQFERLRYELSINSIDDLQNQEYFGNCSIDIISTKNNDYSTISNEDKLNFTLKFLTNAFDVLKGYIKPYKGSEFKPGSFEMFFGDPKIKAVEVDQESERLSKALENKEWYALNTFVGTDEERELIRFIMDTFANIDTIYQDIYLLRNEEVYKIFDFDQGRGFQPDFLLFLWNENEDVYYQVFIEPKGPRRTGDEDWKEEFLREISNQYGIDNVIRAENTKYKLIGLPFFTTQRDIFQREFRDKLNIE